MGSNEELNKNASIGMLRYAVRLLDRHVLFLDHTTGFIYARNRWYDCLRPYHVENTGSRPITEVKQRRARLVLGWVTAWEYRVL